jgi:orotidine-5'-phosphate decarboxylase
MVWKERLIVALDVNSAASALTIVDRLGDDIVMYKIGFELFVSEGPALVKQILARGKHVFLDLKFHDIPNTVAKAAVAAARMGVSLFTVHACGGFDMMRRMVESVDDVCSKEQCPRPKMIAVTLLTSMNNEILKDELAIHQSVSTRVKMLAMLAKRAGLDGVVSSAHEISMIKQQCGKDFLVVTPGIRPSWVPPDDQRRTATPQEAIRNGADFIVMGRAIVQAEDPMRAIELISLEMLTA